MDITFGYLVAEMVKERKIGILEMLVYVIHFIITIFLHIIFFSIFIKL